MAPESPESSLAKEIREEFIAPINPQIAKLVSDDTDIWTDLWVPPEQFHPLDLQVSRFLEALQLPSIVGSPDRPNLLFHNLGKMESSALSHSLKSIFKPTVHMLLVNVSGSGKTRIVLEGLLRNWGLYFVCRDDGTFIGSRDLHGALDRVPQHPQFTENLRPLEFEGKDKRDAALNTNCRIAASIFNAVLLARLIVFNQFLHAVDTYLKTQQQHKPDMTHYMKKWLFLQLYPGSLDPQYEDVFVALTEKIVGNTVENLKKETLRVRDSIRTKLSRLMGRSHFYIVIDEAQEAATKHGDAFMSGAKVLYRPILREIVFGWTELLNSRSSLQMSYVVTGTGVSISDLSEAVGSAAYKHHSHKFLQSSATGAFDSQEEQAVYVRKYIPPQILDTDLGRKLLERMWHWLRGRYRMTTSFLTCLIENCYYKPHKLLDLFIKKTAEFEPRDYDSTRIHETTFPLPFPVEPIMSAPAPKFDNLRNHRQFREVALNAVYDYTLTSIASQITGKDGASLLQYGFARVPSFESNIQMDERLVLLSCLKWANQDEDNNCQSLYERIAKSLEVHKPSDPENGFEHFLTFYFAMAFSEFTTLSTVFDFLDDEHPLAGRRAKLVALKACTEASTDTVYYEEGITKIDSNGHVAGCASSLGRAHNRDDPRGDFDRWLRFQYNEPFYFPDNSAAADIMFVLKLEGSGQYPPAYIWVSVQSKFHQGKPALPDKPHNIPGYTDENLLYLDPTTLSAAIDTTTPRRYSLYLDDLDDRLNDSEPSSAPLKNVTLSKKKHNDHTDRTRKRNQILEAMQELPDRASPRVAGIFSCLRVVASWPAITDLPRFVQRKKDWQDPDRNDGHPLVSLNRETFVEATKNLSPTDTLIRYEKKKRIRLLGEFHAIEADTKFQGRPDDPDEPIQSQVTEPGPEVDYAVEMDIYGDRSSLSVSLTSEITTGDITAMQVDFEGSTPRSPAQRSAPQPGPSIQRQSRYATTTSGPVVRAKTKVRASQPVKATPKDRKRTTYRYEKEKGVSETRKGKQAAAASTLLPAPRKSARLASKAAGGKTQVLQDHDMDVDE